MQGLKINVGKYHLFYPTNYLQNGARSQRTLSKLLDQVAAGTEETAVGLKKDATTVIDVVILLEIAEAGM